MAYSARHLNRQLAIARKVKKDADANFAAAPDNFFASIRAKAVDSRIALLLKYKKAPARGLPRVGTKSVAAVRSVKTPTRGAAAASGALAPKYKNSDFRLDTIVKKKNGNLFVCNLNLLWD